MVTYNGHPLIIAGSGSSISGRTSETYESGTNKNWGKIENIPITGYYLAYHTAAVVGNKVYTFGGYNGNYVTDRVDYLKSRSYFNHKVNLIAKLINFIKRN